MKEPTSKETWRERLRGLYAYHSPDKDGLMTASVSFNWGKFTFEQKELEVSFYLASTDRIEEFIEQELASRTQALIEEVEGKRMLNTKDEADSDWFFGYGYNAALSDILALLRAQL